MLTAARPGKPQMQPARESRAPNHDEYTDVFDHRCPLIASAPGGRLLKSPERCPQPPARDTDGMTTRRRPTAWRPRPARTCSSTRTTRSIGTRGATRRSTRAAAEDKPILLSIGYSACHWCHVMERESFEDEEIAALMNEHFVSIKVDREERPDLDDDLHGRGAGDDRAAAAGR